MPTAPTMADPTRATPSIPAPQPQPAGVQRRALVPGVTVIVPAWNEEASIADTVRSIQAQSVTPVEIIVIDDCSTDRTG
ncbi:MAG TPA: glycosyltransferase, partial [Phycisphaerales bacterium]|nr:glycosyltransferase [Phycisphaerales bacterium]